MSGILLPDQRSIVTGSPVEARAGFRWMVLHTRSRQEKATAELLAAAGGAPYLPLQRRVMYYGHRKRVVETPLFSCYLFLWGLPDHAYASVSAKRVAQIIQVPDQVGFARELAQVRAALDAGAVLGPYRYLTAGRRARVTAGPFEGIEGVIEDHVRNERLILKIHAIGRALSLEIEASLLEPVD
jgi:transcriptional antiterminator RfaH